MGLVTGLIVLQQEIDMVMHPEVIRAVNEYMQVRAQARRGLIGSGAVQLYRDRVRAMHHIYHGFPYRGQ